MRISDPDLGENMVALYRRSDDRNLRLLIEMFLELAGEEWINRVRRKKKSRTNSASASQRKERSDAVLKKENQAAQAAQVYRGVSNPGEPGNTKSGENAESDKNRDSGQAAVSSGKPKARYYRGVKVT